jgi:hypothetical protein
MSPHPESRHPPSRALWPPVVAGVEVEPTAPGPAATAQANPAQSDLYSLPEHARVRPISVQGAET